MPYTPRGELRGREGGSTMKVAYHAAREAASICAEGCYGASMTTDSGDSDGQPGATPPASEPSTWDLEDDVRPGISADRDFELVTNFEPAGSQPQAIAELTAGLQQGADHQVLLGITGSGKTFTMANVIAEVQRPTLVLVHNKTLAAQLYGEFKALFPHNRVEYFVSYYDYYQPEAYVPSTDTFIEKDSNINDQIDRMRHAATYALLSRRDVIIVASVSCIFGIGAAEAYYGGGEELPDQYGRKLSPPRPWWLPL